MSSDLKLMCFFRFVIVFVCCVDDWNESRFYCPRRVYDAKIVSIRCSRIQLDTSRIVQLCNIHCVMGHSESTVRHYSGDFAGKFEEFRDDLGNESVGGLCVHCNQIFTTFD